MLITRSVAVDPNPAWCCMCDPFVVQANRADDPDSCLQYTVNTVSGERQAPPKTEDGTDTEEVATSLAMVYVRILAGDGLPPSSTQAGESSSDAPASAGAAAPPAAAVEPEASTSQAQQSDGQASAAADAAGEAAGCSGRSTPAAAAVQDAAASTSAAPTEGPACQRTANWEEVYKDVLQSIYSSR